MPISIKNVRAEALAREAAKESGETITEAIIHALEERLIRLRGRRTENDLVQDILEIARRCGALPDLDARSPEEILGYNDTGVLQ